ncbi:hypothetical protein Q7P37_008764 [Cladosporium fusiforme]
MPIKRLNGKRAFSSRQGDRYEHTECFCVDESIKAVIILVLIAVSAAATVNGRERIDRNHLGHGLRVRYAARREYFEKMAHNGNTGVTAVFYMMVAPRLCHTKMNPLDHHPHREPPESPYRDHHPSMKEIGKEAGETATKGRATATGGHCRGRAGASSNILGSHASGGLDLDCRPRVGTGSHFCATRKTAQDSVLTGEECLCKLQSTICANHDAGPATTNAFNCHSLVAISGKRRNLLWESARQDERHSLHRGLRPYHQVLGGSEWHLLKDNPPPGFAIKLYDIRSTNPAAVLTFEGHTGNITGVAFHCEGKWMVTSSEDGTVKIWDTRSGHIQRNYSHGVPVNDVVIHPNQGELISCDRGGNVRIWDLGENKCSHQLVPEDDKSVASVTVATDGSLLCAAVSNSVHGSVFVWRLITVRDVTTLIPVTKYRAHGTYITRVLLSPDVRHLATCSADHTARIWQVDLERAQKAAINSEQNGSGEDEGFELEQELDGHQRWVWDCAFSADSAYLVTACSDHYARLWELQSKLIIRQYNGHHRGAVCVALNDYSETR